MIYKNMKVFDSYSMPNSVYNIFRQRFDNTVEFYVNDAQKPVEIIDASKCSFLHLIDLEPITDNPIIKEEVLSGLKYIIQVGDCLISDWLRDNGAELHEEVIITH